MICNNARRPALLLYRSGLNNRAICHCLARAVGHIATPVIVALTCSCDLLLTVSTPSNAIVYAADYIAQRAFRLGGIFFALVGPIAACGFVFLWAWLYLKKIARSKRL